MPCVRGHAERRLRFALTCCDDRIQRIVMRLSDVNGPRGGADKRCRLQVVLAGLPDVVVEDIEADLYAAIDRATDGAGRAVARKIDRQRTLLKQDCPLVSQESSAQGDAGNQQDEEASTMQHLTTLDELEQHVTLLACVEESDAPFISCYLNLEEGPDSWRKTLEDRAHVLRRILEGDDLADLEEALSKIDAWLTTGLLPEAKGVAIFVRGTFGGGFMLPMQFAVPLPNWIAVYPTPNIYHLVELKDNYHRYVVLLAMPDWARILEVNLGAATIQAWLNHSELRRRVGSEWSRSHFQVNQAHRGERFLREKIAVLEQLMDAGGHTHLILAGDPAIIQRVRLALPENLADRLVDVIPAAERDRQADVVIATLSSFIEHEEHESQSVAERLIEGLRSQNLAVAGSAATLDALRWGEVDTLVMARDYQPAPGWSCGRCKAIGAEVPEASTCPQCGEPALRPMDFREALLRLAGQLERPVEVVEQSDALMSLGGVGCLLRCGLDNA